MPIQTPPPDIPQVDLDSEELRVAKQQLASNYALSLVNQTFWWYENFRRNNHDARWNTADMLYYGWVPPSNWEGTKVPRSNLGYQIVFDQVESALPAITQELFAQTPDWFQVEPEEGIDPKEARDVQGNLSYFLEHARDDYGFSGRTEIERSIKSVLLYGVGGVGIEWDFVEKRPKVFEVDIRDFYIDPYCPTPNVDDARGVIRRKMVTLEDIDAMRSDTRLSVPSKEVLYYMSKNAPTALSDQTKQIQELLRGVNFTPGVTDYSPNPAERPLELLMYYTKHRIIWILNRQWVLFNSINPYGCIPFCFAPCYIVPGRFYAQSIPDTQEGNQRTIEYLLNAHLDEINLGLHPPRAIAASSMLTPSQQRWRPGAAYTTRSPKDDIQLLQPAPATANVYNEIQFLMLAADRRTGINSLGSGIISSPSAGRTAAGVEAQTQGSSNRLRHIVSNVENYLIVPMLYKMYKMVQLHSSPGQMLPAVNPQGQRNFVPATSYYKKMNFRMLASSRMMTRGALAQQVPFFTQYYLNGAFMQALQSVNKTVDFVEFAKMIQDATGTGSKYQLIRDMSPQEVQAKQQPSAELQAQQQQKQQELQARMQIEQMGNQTELQKAMIAKQPSQIEQQQAQQELQMQAAMTKLKLQSEQILAQIKARAEAQMKQMELAFKQQELGLKAQESQFKLQASAQEHAQKMQQAQQVSDLDNQSALADHFLGLQQSQEAHSQKMAQDKERLSLLAKNRVGNISKEAPRKKAQIRKKSE